MTPADDEKLVEEWLSEFGLRAERFSAKEMQRSKTPDFRVYSGEEFAFFCEVKAIERDTSFQDLLRKAPPFTIMERDRPNPVHNRVANRIHEAAKQFDSVNPGAEHPNVLVFVNHDSMAGVNDVVAVVTGAMPLQGGGALRGFDRYSNGRISRTRWHVHLYIWMAPGNRVLYRFNEFARPQCLQLCKHFRIDQRDIHNVFE